MLDKKTELMLQAASTLTAEDLDYLRGVSPRPVQTPKPVAPLPAEIPAPSQEPHVNAGEDLTRGERERLRTRESKISTACMGQARAKHEWWPTK